MSRTALLLSYFILFIFCGNSFAAYPGSNGRIAFVKNPPYPPAIYTMNPDGSDETFLVKVGIDWSRFSWSPDGKKIAFTDEGYAISIIGIDSNAITTHNFNAC